MPAVARGNGTDTVAADHGAGRGCGSPTTQATAECSPDVYVNGIGAVREGDHMNEHPEPGDCAPHAPALNSYSPNVYVNGKLLGRLGDTYAGAGGHTISSGSPNVYANG